MSHTNFFEELTWRRMLHQFMPETDKLLSAEKVREILWKLLLSTQSGNPSAVAAHRRYAQSFCDVS